VAECILFGDARRVGARVIHGKFWRGKSEEDITTQSSGELKVKEAVTLPVRSRSDIYTAVNMGRAMANRVGFGPLDQIQLEAIVVQLASNVLQHEGGGTISLRSVERNGSSNGAARFGLEVAAGGGGSDAVDLAQMLSRGWDTPAGVGVSVSSVRQLADEFAMDSLLGRGTRMRAFKWARQSRPTGSRYHATA
jgi:serine/threonine-protein kinase RsbT